MKQQIKRFSPHQNAKVFAILMAVGCLPMLLLMVAASLLAPSPTDAQGNPVDIPVLIYAIFPVIYLVFGYIFVVIGCWIYNLMFGLIGGIEVETVDID